MAVNKVVINNQAVIDITDTTATSSDVAVGKYFYGANGVKTEGTSSGGGTASLVDKINSKGVTAEINADSSIDITGTLEVTENGKYDVSEYAYVNTRISGGDAWVRPSNCPDYDSLDLTNQEVVFLTVDTNLFKDECVLYYRLSGPVTIEAGTIENGSFVVTRLVATGSGTNKWYTWTCSQDTSDTNGFIVYRLKGAITSFYTINSKVVIDDVQYSTPESAVIEIYGRLPSLTTFYSRYQYCIKSITILDAEALTTLDTAARDCTWLENFKVTGLTSLTDLYYAFANDYFLKTVDLDGFDTATVTRIEGAFQNCYSLRTINAILDVSNVTRNTTLQNLFTSCKLLDFDSLGLKRTVSRTSNMSSMFNSSNLRTFDSSKWSFSGVTSINSSFRNCYFLRHLDLSEADMSSITDTSNAFQNTEGLIDVWLPPSLSVISQNTFNSCFSLQEFHFTSETPPTVSNTNAFQNSSSKCKYYVPYSEDHSILEAYRNATNYSGIASYLIEEEPE